MGASQLVKLIGCWIHEEAVTFCFCLKGTMLREKVYCCNKPFTLIFNQLGIKCFSFQCNRVRSDHWYNFNERKLSDVPHKKQFVNKFLADFKCLCFNDIAPLMLLTKESQGKVGEFQAQNGHRS